MIQYDAMRNASTSELIAELRFRGFTVTETPNPIGRRYVFEHLDRAGDWASNGAYTATSDPVDPDELCARWCENVGPGVYRVAVYEGPELVASSEPRTLI